TDNEGHYYTDSSGYNDVTLEELVIPTLSATGEHVWEDVAAASPTCTEPGYAAGTQVCSLCGAYSEDIIPASHVMSELNAAVEPTCTATGNIAYYYCSRCDQYFEDAEGVKRISNSFTKDHKAYCADCGAIVSVTKDAEDNWFCAADESHTNLMNTYVFLDKVAHTMPEGAAAQTIIPTCLGKGGRYFGACTVCGQEIWTNETDALGHNLQWVDGVAATCTKTGKEGYYKCVNGCGTWYRDIRDGEEEDDIEALPNAIEGKKIITEQAIIEKLPHTLTAVDPVESTCTETGNIAYWVCDVCGAYFADEDGETEITDKDSVITGKKDHEFTVIIEQVEGTCQVYARTTYQCANCDATHTERGNKGDHNYVIEQQAATCGADGYTREKCTVCGKTRNEATLAATGNHTPGEWIEEGAVRRTNCTVCGAEMVEPLNPETPTNPDQPATPSGEKCPKCGLIDEGRTGIFVEGGLYCRLVGAIRKLFKK
ncbi:MAG: hypothetical protein IJQ00_01960, partial [Kiritimatiellae bacterium]|nr:hypothetical protein [Kiritimatiellia bacterium]